MGRLSNESKAFDQIIELSTNGTHDIDALLCWSEREMEEAQRTFDTGRQKRLSGLNGRLTQLSQRFHKITMTAYEGRNGRFREVDD